MGRRVGARNRRQTVGLLAAHQNIGVPKIPLWRDDVDGHPIPQPIDHDAIEDIFEGKAADAFYYAAGRWYRQVTAN